MISFSQFQQHFLAQLSQISGYNQIKIFGFATHIIHVRLYG